MANLNAILNYAREYSSVSKYIGNYNPTVNNGSITAGDYAKIFFTGDGHIISHGVDYTPTFAGSAKGLVPESLRASEIAANANAKYKFLGNDGTWKELTVAELPIASNFQVGQNNDGANYIYNAKQVYDFFQSELSVLDVMRFKGPFDPNDTSTFLEDGKCEKGDTYRVTHTGTYAKYELSPGDLLICIEDKESGATPENVNSADYWMVVEANIDGITTHMVNNVPYQVFTSQKNRPAFDIYAPITAGAQDEILISAGGTSAPIWKNKNNFDFISESLKKTIVGEISITNVGTFEWLSMPDESGVRTSLGTYVTEVGKDDWNISITGLSAGTKNKLTLGTGLRYEGTNVTDFNGSQDRKILLSPATRELIGGVIVDNRTTNPLNNQAFAFPGQTISVDSEGMIYLTKDNISNALGFVPGSTENVYAYSQVVTSTTTGTSADSATNPYLNLTSQKENSTTVNAVASTQFIGTNGIKIDGSAGQILFDLQEATTTTYGGIKIAKKNTSEISVDVSDGARTDRYYGVELDSLGKAFVYVPWVDENPAFNKVVVSGGANGKGGEIVADGINSQFTLSAGNGINLVLTDPNNITINQDVWEVVKANKMGYAPAMQKTETELGKSHYILSFVEGDTTASWNKLPQAAFNDTWRAIQVGGNVVADNTATDAAGNIAGSALNFTATGDHNKTSITYSPSNDPTVANIINISSTWRSIFIESTTSEVDKDYSLGFRTSDDLRLYQTLNTDDKVDYISFELSWYNIDEDARETVESET